LIIEVIVRHGSRAGLPIARLIRQVLRSAGFREDRIEVRDATGPKDPTPREAVQLPLAKQVTRELGPAAQSDQVVIRVEEAA
jgi:hypothetical protein